MDIISLVLWGYDVQINMLFVFFERQYYTFKHYLNSLIGTIHM